jgi:hypothetical protein
MTVSETRTVLRSLVERRLTPSQSILFMAWLELMLETEGQTFVWAVQKWQMRMSRSHWLGERLFCIEQEAIAHARGGPGLTQGPVLGRASASKRRLIALLVSRADVGAERKRCIAGGKARARA